MKVKSMPWERWKWIPGFIGIYKVSNCGRVITMSDRNNRGRFPLSEPRLRTPEIDKDGYLKYLLCKDGRKTKKFAHVLVLETFSSPRPEGLIACHIDGDNQNNFIENLRWDTHRSNSLDRIDHGTALRGESHPMSKLTDTDIFIIRQSRQPVNDLARQYRVDRSTIWLIQTHQTWTHLTNKENCSANQ